MNEYAKEPQSAVSGRRMVVSARWIEAPGRLRIGVPVRNAGYTEARSGGRLVAEGVSEVALLPPTPGMRG